MIVAADKQKSCFPLLNFHIVFQTSLYFNRVYKQQHGICIFNSAQLMNSFPFYCNQNPHIGKYKPIDAICPSELLFQMYSLESQN